MTLAELQAYFARAATSGSGPLAELEGVFLGSDRLPAVDRLAIYNRAYFYRLLDALASVFEQTQRVMGQAEFERVGLAYLAAHPSVHPAVERVGHSFSPYLRGLDAPVAIVDLAALEWARLCALVAPNPEQVATVSRIDPSRFPESRLRFVPSVHWLELDPMALRLFVGEAAAPATALRSSSSGVVVWRSHHVVRHESLDETEFQALVSAAEGATLNRVCALFDRGSEAEDVARAFQVLSRWFARDWLESVVSSRP